MTTDDELTIESRLAEQEYFEPPTEFVGQANMADPAVYDRFDEFPEGFEEYAAMLDWDEHWDEVLDDSNPPFYEWFVGGKLNASHNCIDRHLDERKNQTALLWEGEDGEQRNVSYQDLYREVNEMAAALRSAGVEEDDIVTIHLPMVPALPITMLACARIGAPHSVVFAGFSASALAERVDDADSDHVVTIDGYYRRGDFLEHIEKADEAMAEVDGDPDVLAWTRHDEPQVDVSDDYTLVSELLDDHRGERVEPVSRDAEDPLFLMYTSGTTGQPKGCQHRTGGYLAYATGTAKYDEDIKPEDTYWCSADIGWITGHSYIVYGPLSLGTTSVMYEGTPDYPHKGRTWEIAEKYDVDIFHTSPTAVRQFMKWGEEELEGYDFDFRHMTTVGEPIQPEAWLWYYKHVGDESAVIVDTWWQTENGGHMITNLPAIQDMKPGSAGRPAPGIEPAILDDAGEEIAPESGEAGNLAITRPWPGMLQTVHGDDERFIEEYWERFSDTDSDDSADWIYEAGDAAVQGTDGYYRILGRLDDVMNVAGHRLGTMELESAIAEVEDVAEAAVAARDDAEKGEVPDVYVTVREGVEETEELRGRIVESVEEGIGKFARPSNVLFVDELPKTRSGKIMRRLLEDISNDEELGNTSTLADPSVPETIRDQLQAD
ncbi:acetate--CoA ligase [Halococcus thailandensis]|uniref:Acetate--CoA ligase n=1 Tax=Halococcus thailandensis JCM 13552 TaxID=1227457 RepID=M0MZL1_9EURY|nr:acetate--CoA ligase [Halococcus thailandensis]EMA51172.1 AMP-dependent synthetase and ligase [Halococcus thailandensis JCM 13552]